MKKPKIFLGWLSTGLREDAHLYLLRDLRERYGDLMELVLPDMCVSRIFHDAARCAVTEEFLASDCDVLWFLDSDVVPPNHILDLVAHHYDEWQCAGAPYPIYSNIPGTQDMSILYTVYKGIDDKNSINGRGIYMHETPEEGTEIVDGLATGCLFIKREVFAKLEKPYFEFKYDHETRRIKEGEDLGFALKCHDVGVKFFVDYSMVCKHFKRVCLLDMQNYGTQRANAKVIDYDKSIRPQVDEALKASYHAGLKKGREEAAVSAPHIPKTKSGLILPSSFVR